MIPTFEFKMEYRGYFLYHQSRREESEKKRWKGVQCSLYTHKHTYSVHRGYRGTNVHCEYYKGGFANSDCACRECSLRVYTPSFLPQEYHFLTSCCIYIYMQRAFHPRISRRWCIACNSGRDLQSPDRNKPAAHLINYA